MSIPVISEGLEFVKSYRPLMLFIFLGILLSLSAFAAILDEAVLFTTGALGLPPITYTALVVLIFLSLPVIFILKYGKHGR